MNKYHCISADLYHATFEITEKLISRGCKKIAFINGPRNLSSAKERRKAFLQTCSLYAANGVKPLVFDSDLTVESVHTTMKKILTLHEDISAIILYTDELCMEAMRFLRNYSPDTKKEILFAGYDNIPFLKYLDHPPFASVDMLPFQQGEKAAELLIELMNKRDNQAPVQNLKVAAQIVYY
jgi:LacI family transcriptional regulator